MIIATQIIYFNFNGVPARYEPKKFPVKVVNGKDVVVYDLERFFRESVVISRKEYEKLIKEN